MSLTIKTNDFLYETFENSLKRTFVVDYSFNEMVKELRGTDKQNQKFPVVSCNAWAWNRIQLRKWEQNALQVETISLIE